MTGARSPAPPRQGRMTEDRRPEIRKYARSSKLLKWREKSILCSLTELPNEIDPDTGRAVRGTYKMRVDGQFQLRRSYIAAMNGTNETAVKEAFQQLCDHGALSLVRPGRNAHVSIYQALVLRGGYSLPLWGGENNVPEPRKTPPLEDPAWGGKTPPHTYKTPDHPDQSRPPREEPSPVVTENSAARNEHPPTPFASPVTAAVEPQPIEQTGDQDDPDAIFLRRRSA